MVRLRTEREINLIAESAQIVGDTLDLDPEDLAHLTESAEGVKKTNSLLTL